MSAAQLQAHLVTSSFHPLPLIPILCVADDKNIRPLLRSALSQKQALGHGLPIISVRFPSSGPPICEVLLASEDDPPTEGEVLVQSVADRNTKRLADLISGVSTGIHGK